MPSSNDIAHTGQSHGWQITRIPPRAGEEHRYEYRRDDWTVSVGFRYMEGSRIGFRMTTAHRRGTYGRPRRLPTVRAVLEFLQQPTVGSVAHRRAVQVTMIPPQRLVGEQHFGVEIEFTGTHGVQQRVVNAMQQSGMQVYWAGYDHDDTRLMQGWWKVVTDSSCGYELVSPVLQGQAGHDGIAEASRALLAAGARVNRACGLHVHHDARSWTAETMKRVILFYVRHQSMLNQLVARSRRTTGGNTPYNRGVLPTEIGRIEQWTELTQYTTGQLYRHSVVNAQSWLRHRTLEFRQHQGTVEAAKISAWVRLVQAIARAAVDGTQCSSVDLAQFLTDLGFTGAEHAYYTRRAAQLARETQVAGRR